MSERMALFGGRKIYEKSFPFWPEYKEEYQLGITKVLKSGFWGGIKDDSEVNRFEKAFAKYIGCKYAVGVTSGTVALVMALKALNIEENSEIIIPAMSFVATATAVVMAGLVPVFVDIEKDTHCISVDSILANITPKTKGIIPVHIGGYPCNMKKIMDIARAKSLYVLEDCCQAHGAECFGHKVGSWGDCGIFSFAGTKCMTAGEGGIIVTDSTILYERMSRYRNHGRVNSMEYTFNSLGCNFRMNEFQAILLKEQLKNLDQQLYRKKENVEYLINELCKLNIDWLDCLDLKDYVDLHGYFSFAFLYHSENFGNVPKNLMCEIIRSEGIPVGKADVAKKPIYSNPIFEDVTNESFCVCRICSCPNTVNAYNQLIVIGQSVYSKILLLGHYEMRLIIEAIRKIDENREVIIRKYEEGFFQGKE